MRLLNYVRGLYMIKFEGMLMYCNCNASRKLMQLQNINEYQIGSTKVNLRVLLSARKVELNNVCTYV